MREIDKRKSVRESLGLPRTRRKVTQFNPGGIGIGEYVNEEERATTTENGIVIDEIDSVTSLDCGCVTNPKDVKVICDFCASGICEKCSRICSHCGQRGCRYCVQEYVIDGQRVLLCEEGYSLYMRSERIRQVTAGVFGFFVKREG